VTEVDEKLWLENIQLRKQAHSYKSLLARALAKQQEMEDQIEVLKAKVAELQKRLFGRKMQRGCSSEAWLAKRGPRRCRGQQRGTRGHGRQPRTTLPREEVVVQAPEGPVVDGRNAVGGVCQRGGQFSLAELEKLRHWLSEGQCHRSELA